MSTTVSGGRHGKPVWSFITGAFWSAVFVVPLGLYLFIKLIPMIDVGPMPWLGRVMDGMTDGDFALYSLLGWAFLSAVGGVVSILTDSYINRRGLEVDFEGAIKRLNRDYEYKERQRLAAEGLEARGATLEDDSIGTGKEASRSDELVNYLVPAGKNAFGNDRQKHTYHLAGFIFFMLPLLSWPLIGLHRAVGIRLPRRKPSNVFDLAVRELDNVLSYGPAALAYPILACAGYLAVGALVAWLTLVPALESREQTALDISAKTSAKVEELVRPIFTMDRFGYVRIDVDQFNRAAGTNFRSAREATDQMAFNMDLPWEAGEQITTKEGALYDMKSYWINGFDITRQTSKEYLPPHEIARALKVLGLSGAFSEDEIEDIRGTYTVLVAEKDSGVKSMIQSVLVTPTVAGPSFNADNLKIMLSVLASLASIFAAYKLHSRFIKDYGTDGPGSPAGSPEGSGKGGSSAGAAKAAKAPKSADKAPAVAKAAETNLMIGEVKIPREVENRSFLFVGTTGAGKSQALTRALDLHHAQARTGAIVADVSAIYLSRFGLRDGDVIINPFDSRSVAWSPLAEISYEFEIPMIAKSIIPDGTGNSQEWNGYARTCLRAILAHCWKKRLSNADIYYLAAAAPIEELVEVFAGTPAATYVAEGNEKFWGSVRAILSSFIEPLTYYPGNAGVDAFSIRQHVGSDQSGWIFMTYQPDQRDALRSMLAAQIDFASRGLLAMEPDLERRFLFVLDEFPLLGEISTAPELLSNGRKYGAQAYLGMQTISQLKQTYGDDGANNILACLGTWLVLRTTDVETSDYFSRFFGDVERLEKSTTDSAHGWSVSESKQVRRLILPAEIQGLPDLTGYLRVAGQNRVHKVKLPYIPGVKNFKAFDIRKEIYAQPVQAAQAVPAAAAVVEQAPEVIQPAAQTAPLQEMPQEVPETAVDASAQADAAQAVAEFEIAPEAPKSAEKPQELSAADMLDELLGSYTQATDQNSVGTVGANAPAGNAEIGAAGTRKSGAAGGSDGDASPI